LKYLVGVPGASGEFQMLNGSIFGLRKMLRQLVSGVTAPARFWLQVRSRRSDHGVAEAEMARLGWGRRCDAASTEVRPQKRLWAS